MEISISLKSMSTDSRDEHKDSAYDSMAATPNTPDTGLGDIHDFDTELPVFADEVSFYSFICVVQNISNWGVRKGDVSRLLTCMAHWKFVKSHL